MCCGTGKGRLEMNRHRSPRRDVRSRRYDRACRRNPASLPCPFEGEMFFRSGRTRGSCRRNRRLVATPHHQHQSQSKRRAPGFPSLHAIDLQPDTSSAQVAREMPTSAVEGTDTYEALPNFPVYFLRITSRPCCFLRPGALGGRSADTGCREPAADARVGLACQIRTRLGAAESLGASE
jgi:hypothetical protein